jgi:hypothetical protein
MAVKREGMFNFTPITTLQIHIANILNVVTNVLSV